MAKEAKAKKKNKKSTDKIKKQAKEQSVNTPIVYNGPRNSDQTFKF